uniref:Lysosomal enzyme trafficking factor n=1 Tax=Scleropages formosus TaxID=113540 RepID=A0A8C9RT81_SCLFO
MRGKPPDRQVAPLIPRATKRAASEGLNLWRMMNFRQRMGWIGVWLYLLASLSGLYYIFEVNQTYNRLTLHDSGTSPSSSWMTSLKMYLISLPFWLWATLFLIPYLQVFLFIYSCTRADPRTVGYCILPFCLAVVCNRHKSFAKASNQISHLQLIET